MGVAEVCPQTNKLFQVTTAKWDSYFLATASEVTETVMTVSADRWAVGGLMLTTTGTTISSVPEPSVASSPVCETSPKLNWNVCAAGNQYTAFIALIY